LRERWERRRDGYSCGRGYGYPPARSLTVGCGVDSALDQESHSPHYLVRDAWARERVRQMNIVAQCLPAAAGAKLIELIELKERAL